MPDAMCLDMSGANAPDNEVLRKLLGYIPQNYGEITVVPPF